MVTVPLATPVTNPVEVTVAIELLLLVHDPPGVLSLIWVVAPTQTVDAPVIAVGPVGYTV